MVTIEKEISWEVLERNVRQVTLLEPRNGEPVYPYEDASIRLERIAYQDVLPTTLYVIRRNLALQAKIANDISAEGYDSLELESGLVFAGEDGVTTGLIPPLVEETEAEGKYILDGAHRTCMGRWLGRMSFVALYVTGIRPDCPPYAFPNGWDDIKIVEEVPKDPAEKKLYRPGNYRALYRDFSSINGSRPRG